MRRLLAVLLAAFVLAGFGCGSERDRGLNSGKDRPRAAEKQE